MRIAYYSHAKESTGYGRAAQGYIDALDSTPAEVFEVELKHFGNLEQAAGVSGVDIDILHGTPSQLSFLGGSRKSRPAIAVTTWETNFLPLEHARGLSCYDLIIVPSMFCKEVIENSLGATGSKKTIVVVPHCFEPGDWQPREQGRTDTPFTFYSVDGWGERKNVAGVLKAYLHTFRKGDNTQLVLFCRGADMGVLRSIIARSALPQDQLPAMTVLEGPFDDAEIHQLHQDADCYVSASRGEGWGLGMFEAALMQRPVIAPAYGGQLDFLAGTGDQYLPTRFTMTPVFGGEGEVEVQFDGAVVARLTLPRGANAGQLWCEPDLDSISRRMLTAFETYSKDRDYRCFAENRAAMEDAFSTVVIGQRFYDILKTQL